MVKQTMSILLIQNQWMSWLSGCLLKKVMVMCCFEVVHVKDKAMFVCLCLVMAAQPKLSLLCSTTNCTRMPYCAGRLHPAGNYVTKDVQCLVGRHG